MLEFAKIWGLQRLNQTWASLQNHFRDIPEKPNFRAQINLLPDPAVRYVIFFTPRSGSSRLTELVKNAGGCGVPGEHFNPRLIRRAATQLGAQSLQDYIDLLSRRRGTAGVFGSEISFYQLRAVFRDDRRFFDLFRPTASVFLVREDIVAQAVSLSRKMQTGVAHSTENPVADGMQGEFQYRPGQIHDYLGRLLFFEGQFENMFRRRNLEPLRLSYEALTTLSPQEFIPVLTDHIGASRDDTRVPSSAHQKIGDARSADYIARFRGSNARLMAKVEARRRPTLEKLAEHNAKYFAL